MAHSDILRSVQRLMRIGHYCDKQGVPTAEGVEQYAAMERTLRHGPGSRRQFLTQLAAASSLGVGASLVGAGRAHAVPVRKSDVTTAIVGAGLGGLACAYELQRFGAKQRVYEATPALAGRCISDTTSLGQTIELGGEFINTTHTTMRGYAVEFGLTLDDVANDPGEEVFYVDGGHVDAATIVDQYRDLAGIMTHDLTEISNGPTPESYNDVDEAFDYLNLAEYLDERIPGTELRRVLDIAYTVEYGLEIDQQSSLNFLFFAHNDRRGRFTPLGVFSDERFHVRGGNGQIPQALADSLDPGIEYGHALVALARTPDDRYLLTFATDGGTVEVTADAVVLALPFTALRNVELDANLALPAWKLSAIDQLRYGQNAKLMVAFDERTWYLDHDSNGLATIDLPDLQLTWETGLATAPGDQGVLTNFSGGNLGMSQDPSDLQGEAQRFLDAVDQVFPGTAARAVRDGIGDIAAVFKHWPTEVWHQGSYVCNQPGYFTTLEGYAAARVDNLFFAGEHADSFYEWQGFMEGAANTGLTAAADILHQLRSGGF